MVHFKNAWTILSSDRRGVTALEYAVLAAIVVVAVTAGFATLGSGIKTKLTTALT